MRILTTLLLTLATMLPCFGATTWPAATNAPNTFFQTNRFLKQVTFGTPATNIIADSGSSINGVGFTNNAVYGNGSGLTGIPLGALPAGVLTNNYATAVTFNDDLTLGTAASDLIVGGSITVTNSTTLKGGGSLSGGAWEVYNANYPPLRAWRTVTANAIYGGFSTAVTNTSGSGGNGLGIVNYLEAEKSTSAMAYIGCWGGYYQDASHNGSLFFSTATGGADPYLKRDLTLKYVSSSAADLLISGAVIATNGLYYFPQTNGLVYAMTNLTPAHAWGCLMSWGTNLINGGAGTYSVVTNNPSFCTARTNSFGANIAGGVLTNLIAGFYRVAIHLSGVAVDNSAVVEGDLLLNNVVRDEVSFITAFDNPPRIKGMSAFGRLYITNNTPITFQIKSSGANGITVYRAQVDVGP